MLGPFLQVLLTEERLLVDTTSQTAVTSDALSWRRLLVIASIVLGVAEILHAAFLLEPPGSIAGIVYGLLLLLGARWLSRSSGRVAVGLVGFLHAFELFNIFTVYGGADALMNPAAWQDFLVNAFFAIVTALGTVLAIGAFRQTGQARP